MNISDFSLDFFSLKGKNAIVTGGNTGLGQAFSVALAKAGANIILLQELFETPYFCQVHDFEYFNLATEVEHNTAINHFKELAKSLEVVLPISFYEKSGNAMFNSVTIIDADGEILGTYRKTHIPDGIPYAEKFYFTPGDTGF